MTGKVQEVDLHIHETLINECREGSSRAQFRLYKQYSRAMFNLAFRMLNNREDAEDMLQDTFVECFRNLDTFHFQSTFGAWLRKILVNKCINQIRKKKPDVTFVEEIPVNICEEDDETVYDTGRIFRGIEQLPEGYRIILTLYLLEGYDHSEISQILGISESTSKSQYSRAKIKLRNILKN